MRSEIKQNVLGSLARLLDAERAQILAVNREDLDACSPDDKVIVDRLKVDGGKIDAMISALRSVNDRPDPVGRVLSSETRADGLLIENRTVPFGTILIIYEARPDVSIEAAAIAVKAGNRILLKGGKEARNTNLALAALWRTALLENGADEGFVRYLDISREATQQLISGGTEKFDLVIPRGGDALIDFVVKNSRLPVIISGRGNNFLYIDADADLEMATSIAVDGKQRLSVCNALDKVLINTSLPGFDAAVMSLVTAFRSTGIDVHGDETICRVDSSVLAAEGDAIWFEEFLSAKIVIGAVADTHQAIEKINRYSGGHSASIVTRSDEIAQRFLNEVDCAAVYHNASTRFTDGGQLGLGAEIAISTQKLHFRGPLGADQLVTNKWFVYGSGHTRG